MSTNKDPRYKSGEHRAPDPDHESSGNQLPVVTDLSALAVEIRSVRREMQGEFKHINRSLETFTRAIEDLYNKTNAGLAHCSGHDAQIDGVAERVRRMEKKEESDAIVVALSGKHTPAPTVHLDAGRQAVATTVWITLARNRSLPWAIALILGIIAVLASLTGRSSESFVPYHPDLKHGAPAPAPAATIDVKAVDPGKP